MAAFALSLRTNLTSKTQTFIVGPMPSNAMQLTLPPVIYAVPNAALSLYFDNIVLTQTPQSLNFSVECGMHKKVTGAGHGLALSVTTNHIRISNNTSSVVHPNQRGYQQIGISIYAWFNSRL